MKLLLPTLLAALATAPAALAQGPSPAEPDVFGLTRLHALHLHVSAKEWDRMQPAGGMPFFGIPKKGPDKPVEKPAVPVDAHKSAGFGIEFPWVHADLTAGDATFKNVGLRYKGNGSYVTSTGGLKRNFKIDLQHYDEGPLFHGRKSITLNAGAMDASRLREALAYAVFRAAGVPAPRTAFAEVVLTVPGKYDKEPVGLYTLVEPVDRVFVKEHFKNGHQGLLLKPEKMRGLDYLGDDWAKYKDRYQPKRDATAQEAQRVIAFTRLVNLADDAQFQKEIGSYLEIDAFLRFVAVNALVANMDSFLSLGHNYFLYLHPQTNRFTFIPWDLDLAFAGFPLMASPEQQTDLSLVHPYFGQNKLVERLFAMPQVEAQYRKVVRALTTRCFTKETLFADIDAIDKVVREPLAREKQAVEARKEGKGGFGFGPPGMFGKSIDVRGFIDKRTVSVAAQLDGKSKGYVPVMMPFGPGGPPGGFGLGNQLAKPLLRAVDADKNGKVTQDELLAAVRQFFDDCDKDRTGKLDEKAIMDGLAPVLPPPGFQAMPLAGIIVRRADADKDGKVTKEELLAAAAKHFEATDKDKQGALDEPALIAAINQLAPAGPPAGFGPGNFLAKPLLQVIDSDKDGKVTPAELTAAVKQFFDDCDKDRTGTLDEAAIADGLARIFPMPPGAGKAPAGFGPGKVLAAGIVKRADTDKDGKVTRDELVAAAAALFREADKDKKGTLDEAALAAGINLLFPAPAFGPPGGPGGFGPPVLLPKKDG